MLNLINQISVFVYYIDFGMYLSNTYKNAMAFSYVEFTKLNLLNLYSQVFKNW